MKFYQCTFKRTKPMLIISNGSERGDFIPMEYVTRRLGRIHDGVQLMKTYHPYSPYWSFHQKISEIQRDPSIQFAWDYEYEDYHPFNLMIEDGDCLPQFVDVKKAGADIHLTLTMDPNLPDKDIIEVIQSLDGYGRIFLRINHEANGTWFPYSKYYSYREVNDFFVRCHKLCKQHSSNIFTLFSVSGDFFAKSLVVNDVFLRMKADELKGSMEAADYLSIDRYVSLHYAWPFAEVLDREKTDTYFDNTVEDWWRIIEECYLSMIYHNKCTMKPLFINEFNADADVNGVEAQAEIVGGVYDRIASGDFKWLAGISLYQFRDHGGLGLQRGDLRTFQDTPSLNVYKDAVKRIQYDVDVEDWREWPHREYTFGWFHSDSIKGLCLSDCGGARRFTNRFPFPVYLVTEAQEWILLPAGQGADIPPAQRLYIAVPPHTDGQGRLCYSYKLENLGEFFYQSMAEEVCATSIRTSSPA